MYGLGKAGYATLAMLGFACRGTLHGLELPLLLVGAGNRTKDLQNPSLVTLPNKLIDSVFAFILIRS